MLKKFLNLPGLVSLFAVLLFAIVPIAWFGIANLERTLKQDIADQLQTNVNTIDKSLSLWTKNHKAQAFLWANDNEVREAVLNLSKIVKDGGWTRKDLRDSVDLQNLRRILRPVAEQMEYIGFVVIGKDGINIAALLDEPVGKKNLLERSDFVQRAMNGDIVISTPFTSAVTLPTVEREWKKGLPTMFVSSPVFDGNGNVAAVLSFRIRPEIDFTRLFRNFRVGESGESYAFNAEGRMISESRFEHQLRPIGLMNKMSMLEIEIRNPGGNMIEGFRPSAPRSEQPFTLMAASAIKGETGFNVDGYNDYRGVPVVGAWTWLHEFGFGFTSEIDVSEAYQTYYTTRRIVLSIVSVTVAIFLGLSFALLRQRQEALMLAEGTAESNRKLEEAQSELKKSMALQSSISEIAPNAHILIDEKGVMIKVNPAASTIFGYRESELAGKNVSMLMPSPHRERHDGYLENYAKTGAPNVIGQRRDMEAVRKNGEIFPIALYIGETKLENQSVFVGIVEDITEQKRFVETLKESEKKLSDITDSIGEGICVVDESMKIVFVNPETVELLGWPAEELLGSNPHQMFHYKKPDGSPYPINECEVLNAIRQGVNIYGAESYFIDNHGRPFPVLFTVTIIKSDGAVSGGIIAFQDITERKRAEELLAERATLAELSAEIGQALTRSGGLEEILQRCAQAIVSSMGAAFARIWILDGDKGILELHASAGIYTHLDGAHSKIPVGQFKIGLIAKERKPYLTNTVIGDDRVHDQDWAKREGLISFAGYPLIAGDDLLGVVAFFSKRELHEITVKALSSIADEISIGVLRARAEIALLEMSLKDGLTGLANRRRFDEALWHEWQRAQRDNYPVSLVMIDIDFFKPFNDTYCHQEGDKCLQKVSGAVGRSVNRPADLAARYGGEELAVILPSTDADSAFGIAEKIRLEIEALKIPHEGSMVRDCKTVSISAGIATLIPEPHSAPDGLVKLADEALYEAKSQGRNRVTANK